MASVGSTGGDPPTSWWRFSNSLYGRASQRMFNPSYVGPRQDILRLVPPGLKRVLDVGCSVGTLGQALRERGAEVTGIEIDPRMAAEA
ncbi:MAG: methyltransferase domain-containing protein, partial [Acidobacteria bacterium]